ncbi:hypothetical protein B0H63DRAFT_110867 [Podospora didyma]|uniref:Glycoside hydrolase n=1 Tax=Podospora didyma TaxID=330526 RepID=A0AAE0U4L4_9PEZI|nr:hypothetical protein B0H63DRAFT_110867 [Podospora didyma]
MAAQLPADALGAAVAILIYSFLCLVSGAFLVWLIWIHNERQSYVALLASFMCLQTLASIIQQIHTIVSWRDVKTSEWENMVANVGNPELHVTGASTGFDRILFYIQYYSYNVDAMIVLFWSIELAYSIYQLRAPKFTRRIHASLVAKGSAVVLPAIQMVLLRFSPAKNNTTGLIILADFIMIASFAVGGVLLLGILGKYVHARVALQSWNVQYGQASIGTSSNGLSGTGNGNAAPPRRKTIYDKWLIIRFTIAFVALSCFELVVIFFQLRAAGNNTRQNIPAEPDLTAAKAIGDFALFLPGVTACPLAFVVFGTTRTFRDYMWTLFTPKSFQEKRLARRRARKPSRSDAAASVPRQQQQQQQRRQKDEESGGESVSSYGVRLTDMSPREDKHFATAHDDELPILKPSPVAPPPMAYR